MLTPMTRVKASRCRRERIQSPATNHGALSPPFVRATIPRAMSSSAQTARPAAMTPGKSAGPTFCPGILGKLCTCSRMAMESSRKSAPQTASLTFMRSPRRSTTRTVALFHYPHCLHRRAQVRVRLGHELDEVVRGRVDHPEAALGHELVVFLAGDDLPDRGNELVARFGGDAFRRGDPAPGCHGPAAAGRFLQRWNIRVQRGALFGHHRQALDLA